MEPSLDLKREIPVLDWSAHLATRAQGLEPSVLCRTSERTDRLDVIPLAGRLQASEFFLYWELDEACRSTRCELGVTALQCSVATGCRPLRENLG